MPARPIWNLAATIALGGFATLSLAQTTTIQPLRKVETKQAIVQNTWSVLPQINPSKGPIRDQETNEREVPLVKRGVTNSLRATRGQINELVKPADKPRWPGVGATGWTPPDPTAAISSSHVVITVNSDIAFFTRTGTKLFQQGLGPGGFFEGVATTSFAFDPKVLFDPITKRFFVICCELDDAGQGSGMLVAVSDDEDPRGNWNKYRIDTKLTLDGNSYWLDYPGFGFNKDRIVFTGNMFGFTSGWAGVQVFSLNKANLIAGNTSGSTVYHLPNEGSVQWTKSFDPALPVSFGGSMASTTAARLFAISNTEDANSPIVATNVAIPEWQFPSPARSAEGRQLDALDARMLTMGYRNGRIVGSHGIKAPGTSNVSARWYDFATNGWPRTNGAVPSLNQAGEITGTAEEDSFMPGININRLGSLGFIYSRSGTNTIADVMVTGRRSRDAKGLMLRPTSLATSNGAYGGAGGVNRWGDYFSVEVDPVDGRTFWGIGMTSNGGNWQTDVVSWTLPAELPAGIGLAPTLARVYAGQGLLQSGNTVSLAKADGATFNVRSVLVKNLGQAAAIEVAYKNKVAMADIAALSFRVKARGPLKGTQMIWFYNFTTKKYEYIQSKPTNNTYQTNMIEIAPANMATYMDANGNFRAIVRTLVPLRQGSATSFTSQTDEAVLLVTKNE